MDFSGFDKPAFGRRSSGMPGQEAKPKNKKNFWLDQISTVGGIAGGIAGAPLGILGVGGGAAVGSGLGEALENLITGDDVGKNVVKETALGGVFGAGPGKLLKGGVTGAAKLLGREAAEGTTRTATQRGAQGLLGNAWGLKEGAKVGGKVITPQEAGSLQRFVIDEIGVPKTANASMVFEKAVNFSDETGNTIGNLVKQNNKIFNTADKRSLHDAVKSRFGNVAGVKYEQNPQAMTLLEQIRGARNLDDLWNLRRNIDKRINFSRGSNTPDPVFEQFATEAREELNNRITGLVPQLSPLNKSYNQVQEVIDLVAPAANKPRGIVIGNNRIGGSAAQRIQSRLGQLKAGGGPPPPGDPTGTLRQLGVGSRATMQPSTFKGVGGLTNRGIASRLGAYGTLDALGEGGGQEDLEGAILDSQSLPNSTTTTQNAMNPNISQPNMMDTSYAESGNMSSPYSREQALEDILMDVQTSGGKNIDKIQAIYEFANPEPPKGSQPKPLSGEAQKRALTAQSGLRSLDTLDRTLGSDPGAFQRQALPNPMGITGRLTGTTDIRAATDNIVDVIARLRSGAAITDQEAKRFARFLPLPGDSPESALRKLQSVRAELESFVSPEPSGGSLEDLLMQYGPQYQ